MKYVSILFSQVLNVWVKKRYVIYFKNRKLLKNTFDDFILFIRDFEAKELIQLDKN